MRAINTQNSMKIMTNILTCWIILLIVQETQLNAESVREMSESYKYPKVSENNDKQNTR